MLFGWNSKNMKYKTANINIFFYLFILKNDSKDE